MNRTRVCSFGLATGLLVTAVASAESLKLTAKKAVKSLETSHHRPGVVVDHSRQALYLMSPEGGIEAVSPSTGATLWSTGEAAVPLALQDGLIVAQGQPADRTGSLEVVFLAPGTGEPVQRLSLELPEDIAATVDEGLATAFSARAVSFEGQTVVRWDHTRRYAGGAAPPPDMELETKRAGAYRLDRAAGRAEPVGLSLLKRPASMPATAREWASRQGVSTQPAAAGEIFAATRAEGDRLLLQRWTAAGTALPEIELFSGPYLHEVRSADGRHLAVVDRAALGEWEEHEWTVFSLETGERLGEIPNRLSHAWFTVQGGTLIHVAAPTARRVGGEMELEPLLLRAIDVATAALRWERPLRDTSYRGPFPP